MCWMCLSWHSGEGPPMEIKGTISLTPTSGDSTVAIPHIVPPFSTRAFLGKVTTESLVLGFEDGDLSIQIGPVGAQNTLKSRNSIHYPEGGGIIPSAMHALRFSMPCFSMPFFYALKKGTAGKKAGRPVTLRRCNL